MSFGRKSDIYKVCISSDRKEIMSEKTRKAMDSPMVCAITGKSLIYWDECTPVNWYSRKERKVVTTFLALDNSAPEVKEMTDTISETINALFELHKTSPTHPSNVKAEASEVDSSGVEVQEKAETF